MSDLLTKLKKEAVALKRKAEEALETVERVENALENNFQVRVIVSDMLDTINVLVHPDILDYWDYNDINEINDIPPEWDDKVVII
tara:strand:- start:992 stop:1246 length:255 start_codon:yes stop_codon:yes gene_type:complete